MIYLSFHIEEMKSEGMLLRALKQRYVAVSSVPETGQKEPCAMTLPIDNDTCRKAQ